MQCKKCRSWMEEISSEDLNSMSWGWHVTLWCKECGTVWTGDRGQDSNRREKYSEGIWNFVDDRSIVKVDREDLQNRIVGIERFIKHPRSKLAHKLAETMLKDMQGDLDNQNALEKKE